MQPDRRLVQDVEHTDQRRADLGRQPDPLRLAARQRRRPTVHRQVADPDVDQERQPFLDLAHDQVGDLALRRRQLDLVDPLQRAVDRERRELVDAEPADQDVTRTRLEPRPLAVRARDHRHVLLDLLLDAVGVGVPVAPLEVDDHALGAHLVRPPGPGAAAEPHRHLLAVRVAEEDAFLLLEVELAPRYVQRYVELRRQPFE